MKKELELKIITDAYKKIAKETSTVPSLDEIAKVTNIPVERIMEIFAAYSMTRKKWWKGISSITKYN